LDCPAAIQTSPNKISSIRIFSLEDLIFSQCGPPAFSVLIRMFHFPLWSDFVFGETPHEDSNSSEVFGFAEPHIVTVVSL